MRGLIRVKHGASAVSSGRETLPEMFQEAITTCCPHTSESLFANGLARASPPPPAANGTTKRTYRFG